MRSGIRNEQAGFTLIELVVVIVILGILAATALPRFVDMGTDARAGVMKGVEASMRATNTMLYAKAVAQGVVNSSSGSVTVNGNPVAVKFGYAADISALAGLMTLSPSTDFNTNTTDSRIEHKGAASTNASTCQVTYAAPTASGGEPTYTTTTTNCQ